MSKVKQQLVPKVFEGEVQPPPTLEQEAAECRRMIEDLGKISKRVNRLNDRVRNLNDQVDDMCVVLGRKLNGMKKRIEASKTGDNKWWPWFERFIPDASIDHASRWMSIAAKPDAGAAALNYRHRAAGYQRKYRENQRQISVSPSDSETEMESQSNDELESQPEPVSAVYKPPIDYLAEAARLKGKILELMPLMRPIESEMFLRALVKEVEEMVRSLHKANSGAA
jgi:hypothetical protein